MKSASFDMTVRATAYAVQAGWHGELTCPACDTALTLHQPEDGFPRRILATCPCEECAIWLALVFTPDRKLVHMVRIPSTAEFSETTAGRTSGNGHP